QFAEEDKRIKEEAEIRNNADSLLYTAEKTKKDLADKLSTEQLEKIDTAETELRKTFDEEDSQKVKAKTEELARVLQEIGTAVYQKAAAEQAAQNISGEGADSKEKVVDADYEEVKEEK
ncbi:MAG: Hsp70 family protein, partial [Candidatus Bathyarchaeota archaeon]